MKRVSEDEITIISRSPVVIKYKDKEYICFRGSEYVSYDELPKDCFEVRFSRPVIYDMSRTLTFVPKE
jgi:hypothetical protein